MHKIDIYSLYFEILVTNSILNLLADKYSKRMVYTKSSGRDQTPSL
jgi:hypothetical protein